MPKSLPLTPGETLVGFDDVTCARGILGMVEAAVADEYLSSLPHSPVPEQPENDLSGEQDPQASTPRQHKGHIDLYGYNPHAGGWIFSGWTAEPWNGTALDHISACFQNGSLTEEFISVLYNRRFGVKLIAITSKRDSALGRAADVGLFLPASQEACPNGLAPTTSTTMQMVAGDALAVLLLERRGFTPNDFQRFHPGGKLGARLSKARDVMHTDPELPVVTTRAVLSEAIVEMTSKRLGVTGIVDQAGTLVGVLTDGDLRRAFKRGFVDGPVTEVMGTRPHTVGPDVLAVEVLAHMNQARITCIFIVDGNKPVGLVHVHDLLRVGIV
jgi:arabinose-5-phosphate isomerase